MHSLPDLMAWMMCSAWMILPFSKWQKRLPAPSAKLIPLRADIYFDLELYSAFASLMALWAITRNRVGFYRRSTTLKNGIYTHLVLLQRADAHSSALSAIGKSCPARPATHLMIFVGPIQLTADDSTSLATKLITVKNFHPDCPTS